MNEPATVHWMKRPSWQRFMLAYLLVYAAVSIGLLVTLGPPGMSGEFLSEYQADYDRYVETKKLDSYKRWQERPALNPPDADLAQRIEFVSQFSALTQFADEQRRRTLYETLSDLLGFAMVLVLVLRFGREPIAALLDGMVEKVRSTLQQAQDARDAAGQRKAAADTNLAGLPVQEAEIFSQSEKRIEDMRRQAALATGESLAVLNRETEDRMQHEEVLARARLKQELVDAAIESLSERFRTHSAPEENAALVDQFIDQLETRS